MRGLDPRIQTLALLNGVGQRPRSQKRLDRSAWMRGSSPRMTLGLRRDLLLLDFALQGAGTGRKLGLGRLDQERVEAAAMLNRAQRSRGDAQTHATAERFRGERHPDEIGQKPRLGFAVRVADQ